MSGYPYGGGQWPPLQQPPPRGPQQPQFTPYNYGPPSNPPQPPSNLSYQFADQIPSSAHSQLPPSANYYNASQESQAAFEYNANRASGLGIAVPAPRHRSPDAIGGNLSWNEAFPTTATASPSGYPPYTAPQQQTPGSSNVGPVGYQQQFHQQHTPLQHQMVYSPPSYPAVQEPLRASPRSRPSDANVANVAAFSKNSELEEGELGQEDMEDVYNPEDHDTSSSAALRDPSVSNGLHSRDERKEASKPSSPELPGAVLGQAAVQLADLPSRDVSVIDTQEDAFYDEDEEEPGEIKSNGNGASASDAADADDEDMGFSDSSEHRTTPPAEQQRAMSYSPRLSPSGVEANKVGTSNDSGGNINKPATGETQSGEKGAQDSSAGDNRVLSPGTRDASSTSKLPFASLEEGKKEAQRAILGLISYGVNYQTYLDEGFDDKVIKSLFSELGLKATPANTTESPKSASPKQAPAAVVPPSSSKKENGPKKEERKDRIARLLAAKASKPSTASPAPATQATGSTQQDKPETKLDKQRLLQQKLEALKRRQELRETAAAEAVVEATALSQSIANQENETTASGRGIASKSADAPAGAPTQQGLPSATLQPQETAIQLPSIPQASASPAPQQIATANAIPLKMPQPVVPLPPSSTTTGGSRKRPVATDFGDFSSTSSNPLKRPFSLIRQESSLVIDVSDDSDDDVEMEVDSQNDELPANTPRGPKAARGGNSLKYFPPLSGTSLSPHQLGRLPSAMPTPPNGPANGSTKAKDDEYARKMREIEEMKRKIAEAEAKKARNTPTGSRTPQTAGSTPPAAETDTSKPDMQRVASAVDVARDVGVAAAESAAAEFFSDVLGATLPKTSDARSSSRESHREKRVRIASQQLPRVEASLQEKMFKLKLFQERIAALQAEIDAGMAEKQRLTLEMDELANEQDELGGRTESTPPQPQPEATPSVPVEQKDLQQADAQSDIGPEPPASLVQQEDDHSRQMLTTGDAAPPSVDEAMQVSNKSSRAGSSIPVSESEADAEAEAEADAEVGGYSDAVESDAESNSESVQMSVVSSHNEPTPDEVDEDGDVMMENEAEPEEEVDLQESFVAGSELPEAHPVTVQASTSGTSVGGSTAPSLSAFVPYESPLQYFRSYRFHPQYKDSVKGGLKSLTYSGRIQDNVELCPYELDGQDCPDPSCRFQHYASIVPQDDQILVELGRSDDFAGEQKAQFVNGLKEVLKRVRDAKVRDFDTIADEIIKFRRTFLGDDSKVLSHLEGVTI